MVQTITGYCGVLNAADRICLGVRYATSEQWAEQYDKKRWGGAVCFQFVLALRELHIMMWLERGAGSVYIWI
jgi:hypothetical protein